MPLQNRSFATTLLCLCLFVAAHSVSIAKNGEQALTSDVIEVMPEIQFKTPTQTVKAGRMPDDARIGTLKKYMQTQQDLASTPQSTPSKISNSEDSESTIIMTTPQQQEKISQQQDNQESDDLIITASEIDSPTPPPPLLDMQEVVPTADSASVEIMAQVKEAFQSTHKAVSVSDIDLTDAQKAYLLVFITVVLPVVIVASLSVCAVHFLKQQHRRSTSTKEGAEFGTVFEHATDTTTQKHFKAHRNSSTVDAPISVLYTRNRF